MSVNVFEVLRKNIGSDVPERYALLAITYRVERYYDKLIKPFSYTVAFVSFCEFLATV